MPTKTVATRLLFLALVFFAQTPPQAQGLLAGEVGEDPPPESLQLTVEASWWTDSSIDLRGVITNVSDQAVHVVTYGDDAKFGLACLTPYICTGCDCGCSLIEIHRYDLGPGESCTFSQSYCAEGQGCFYWLDPSCIHERPSPGTYSGSFTVFGVPGIEIPDPVVLGEFGFPAHWAGFVPQPLVTREFTHVIPSPDLEQLRGLAGEDLLPPHAAIGVPELPPPQDGSNLRLALSQARLAVSGETSYASGPNLEEHYDDLLYTWSLLDGPAPVDFLTRDAAATEVFFSAPGDYEIALRVEDGYFADCGAIFFPLGGDDTATVRVTVVSSAFRRGDVNDDTAVDVSDAVALLLFLFGGLERVDCLDACDVDDSGVLDVTDAIGLLGFLFRAGLPPSFPFRACDDDPSLDALDCRASARCGGAGE